MNHITSMQRQIAQTQVQLNRYTKQIGYPMPRGNFQAAAAPTVNDDADDGYGHGSIWIYSGDVYICTDPTATAAVWTQINN